jgi:hypothetical protein
MFNRALPLLMVVAACGSNRPETPPPDWLIGKYQYTGNGSVAGKFPWDAKADLVLDRDAQYTLSVNVHISDDEGGDTDTDESYGTYYVSGDRLILEPASEDDDGDTETFRIRGKRLVPELSWTARAALKSFKVPSPVFVKTD